MTLRYFSIKRGTHLVRHEKSVVSLMVTPFQVGKRRALRLYDLTSLTDSLLYKKKTS